MSTHRLKVEEEDYSNDPTEFLALKSRSYLQVNIANLYIVVEPTFRVTEISDRDSLSSADEPMHGFQGSQHTSRNAHVTDR